MHAILLLAQTQPWSAPTAPPPPPEVQHWLLERPISMGAVLLIIAVLTIVLGRAQGRPRAAFLVGTGIAGLAAAVVLASALITTDRERVRNLSREFVSAVGAGDAGVIAPLLGDRLLVDFGGGSDEVDHETVVAGVRMFPGTVRFESWAVADRRATITGSGRGSAQVRCLLGGGEGGGSLVWWEIHWAKGADEPASAWRVERLVLLTLNGREVSGLSLRELVREGSR